MMTAITDCDICMTLMQMHAASLQDRRMATPLANMPCKRAKQHDANVIDCYQVHDQDWFLCCRPR